jgi:hypothetical protein
MSQEAPSSQLSFFSAAEEFDDDIEQDIDLPDALFEYVDDEDPLILDPGWGDLANWGGEI